ncbi:MAG: DNA gyrase C-terminal beta-propeller domain-containing protein [Acetobacterium sp.]|nr:DNA gyrase C-terminal beta-propeller domain-containing protein [Acetobacterium sp.]
MITNAGKIIRITMEQMRVIGRNTQGVRMFNLAAGEKVVAMDIVAETDAEEDLLEEDLPTDTEEEI